MSEPGEMLFTLERGPFFSVGRALQRGIGKELLGHVTLAVSAGTLTVSSDWGGSQIPCVGKGDVQAQITAKAFCSLVTTRYREKAPSGMMELIFRPGLREVAIDAAGIKAKFNAPS
jgi:hypothetical protein